VSVQFFGQFLVHRGAISADQLVAALSEQNSLHLASLAVAKGILLPADVAMVLQKLRSATDDFGEAAVRNKVMTAEQLAYLRFVQKSDLKALCAVLTQKGFVAPDDLARLTEEFRKEQEQFSIRPQRLPQNLAGRADVIALMSMIENHLKKYGIVPAQLSEPRSSLGDVQLRDLTVRTKIGGDVTGSLVLSFDRSLAVVIAGQVLGATDLHVDELLCDAIREFCSWVAGAASSQLSASGHHLTFSAPESVNASGSVGLAFEAGVWEIQTPWGSALAIVE
jgi:CheY-specific phosphatase CheX